MGVTDISKVNNADELKHDEPTPDVPFVFDDPSKIQCPHCGAIQWSLDESEPELYQDDEPIKRKCDYTDCGKEFQIEVHTSYSYWTDADVQS